MAAGVSMLVMLILVGVFVRVSRGLVAVFMAVVAMRCGLMPVLVLMLVFAVAAHQSSLLLFLLS
jgi:hypothetical protein